MELSPYYKLNFFFFTICCKSPEAFSLKHLNIKIYMNAAKLKFRDVLCKVFGLDLTVVKRVMGGPSVAATLFDNHVLMVSHSQVIILIVQHGQWAEACRYTGRTGHSFWMVMTQEALKYR